MTLANGNYVGRAAFHPDASKTHVNEGDQEGEGQLLGRNRTFLEDSDEVLHGTKL